MVVTLIGYRGTGKSTVGRLLAERLQWTFVDLDDEIERAAGKTIARIFAEDGEPEFRRLEAELLQRGLGGTNQVLSVGGGAILNAESRRRMKDAGPVVWLQASPETIADRLAADAATSERRPSLTGKGVEQEIVEVLARREPLYRDAATMTVCVDRRVLSEIVDEIASRILVE